MAASAMKNIDEIPEEVVEIGLDAGILQAFGKRIEHVSDRTGGKSRIGQWARIGLVVERTISKELHLLKKQMGRPRLEGAFIKAVRSEERRVGKEGVRTCRSRWSPDI